MLVSPADSVSSHQARNDRKDPLSFLWFPIQGQNAMPVCILSFINCITFARGFHASDTPAKYSSSWFCLASRSVNTAVRLLPFLLTQDETKDDVSAEQ